MKFFRNITALMKMFSESCSLEINQDLAQAIIEIRKALMILDRIQRKLRVVCQDCVHIQTDQTFHGLLLIDGPYKYPFALPVKRLHRIKCRKGLLNGENVACVEVLHIPDSDDGRIGKHDIRILFPDTLQSVIVL